MDSSDPLEEEGSTQSDPYIVFGLPAGRQVSSISSRFYDIRNTLYEIRTISLMVVLA